MQQISLGKTLDVEVVERELAALWEGHMPAADSQAPNSRSAHQDKDSGENFTRDETDNTASAENDAAHLKPESTGASHTELAASRIESADAVETESAVLRARAANLLVFVNDEKALVEVEQLLPELTAAHPSRVLTMFAMSVAPDRDIEMYVSALTQENKLGGPKRLCCEHVTLKAQGTYISELPSAALPLLVSDLPVFLWWRGVIDPDEKLFNSLLHAADRLVIDSVEFSDPARELLAINNTFQIAEGTSLGISDLNWARLTSWRGLLADFYDVPSCQKPLNRIDAVHVSYAAPGARADAIAPQALLMAGWLASRLQWKLKSKQASDEEAVTRFEFTNQQQQTITVSLSRSAAATIKPGRLAQVELQSSLDAAAFKVARSADGQRLVTEAVVGEGVHRGRVLPVRNRSTAQLLTREMEILCNDQIYQEALAIVSQLGE